MAGTKAGGLKAAATNKERYGKDYYSRLGKRGGKNGHTGGFAANPALARIAGAKGGKLSKRGPAKKKAPYKDEYIETLEQGFGNWTVADGIALAESEL